VDTETTGLDPNRHAIWEVALITPNGDEHVWQFPVDEMAADPFALEVGHYWQRRWDMVNDVPALNAIYDAHTSKSRRPRFPEQGKAIKPSAEWCRHFRNLTAGLHIVGAVPSFDEERLCRLLHSHGVLHRWHYHLVDVEALAAGRLGVEPPWNSRDLAEAIGVVQREEDKHTALGDARWAKAIYDEVFGMVQ
jgi:hypothetical protein